MTGRPVAALTDSVARQIVAEYAGQPEAIAVALADEILALGRWKPNTCAPLLRAYAIAAESRGGGPKLNPLAVLQRAARRAEGERDTAALDRCDRCHRPLPHNDAESRVCRAAAAGWGTE